MNQTNSSTSIPFVQFRRGSGKFKTEDGILKDKVVVTNENPDVNSYVLSDSTDSAVSADSGESTLQTDYSLPTLQAVLFSCILEDCVDQLAILGNIGNLPKVQADLRYRTLEQKFAGAGPDVQLFDPETIEPYAVALEKQKLIKFQTDRSYVEKVLKATIKELTNVNKYQTIVKALNDYDLSCREENALLDEAMKTKQQLQTIKKLLEKEIIQARLELQAKSECIGQLKDQIEDRIFESGVKLRYLDRWENSRSEQNNARLDKSEDYYMSIVNNSKLCIEREVRINAEICSFIAENQKEYEEGIQTWMETYDKEVEMRDTEMQILKEKREEQFTQLEALTKLYDEHKIAVNEYLIVKENRRIAQEFLERQIKAAIKIQAWWRGTMVRRNLGPYRKKKGKGKDKGKGKKEKKK